MIPRTLVPTNVRPVNKDEVKKAPSRTTTYMDDRTVVPSGVSDAPPLDGRTTIPSHLPLGVLVDRTLVPRGMAAKPIERVQHISTVTLEILDSRTVVPAYIEPLKPEEMNVVEHAPEMTAELREIVDPDIFTTGDANLLIEPEEKQNAKSDLLRAVLSVLVHIAVLAFLILAPKLLPTPTQQPIADNLPVNWMYSPPSAAEPAKPTPKVNVNRNTLEKVAPPEIKSTAPAPPEPVKPSPELPEAPRPKNEVTQPQPPTAIPSTPAPSHVEPIMPVQPNKNLQLGLSNSTPGKMIEDQMQSAAHESHGQAPIYGSGGPSGGAGHGVGMGYGVDILSDTQGVDFRDYINRLLAALKRNWEAVMPESARMGDRGVVFTTFSINPDGSVSAPDPALERTSGKEPLDNAAMSAIHASNPFEPLPKQFHGPYLKLRIVFIYNIPPEQVNLH
ncbi:MAG TPA: TonB C-terminal domain-containing protein [Candidatus Acidoferrum sp.]|nr:TonB C-terminal domain-containing protein [Candidatus Acidoferrum sp.]